MPVAGSRNRVHQKDLHDWARQICEIDLGSDAQSKAVKLFWEQLSECSEREFYHMLGGSAHIKENSTQLAKLAALGRQGALADRLKEAVHAAVQAIVDDGLKGSVYEECVKSQIPQEGVLVLTYNSGASVEIEGSGSEGDDLSFISEGGQSGLEEARLLIKEAGMRRYQAFGDMGYATVGDAVSQDGRPREAACAS